MKLKITFSSAWVLGLIALATRLFTGISIDQPDLFISGWMSAFLGALLCLPMLWAAGMFSRSVGAIEPVEALKSIAGTLPVAILEIIFLLVLLWDAAGVSIIAVETMGYATMIDMRGIYFLIPLCLVMFLVMFTNGDGIGGAARLWLWLFPWFFLLVFCLRFKNYEFRWLTPIFGAGGPAIISGGIAAGGWLAPAAALWLIAEPSESRLKNRRTIALLAVLVSICAAILLVLRTAMTPAQIGGTGARIFLMDSILSNGRAALGTQLPMLILWFASQLIALAFDLFLSAALLQRLIPKLDGCICALFVSVIAGGVAWFGYAERDSMLLLANVEYLLISLPFFAVLGIVFFRNRKGGERSCEKPD